jgi:hypothetical protein
LFVLLAGGQHVTAQQVRLSVTSRIGQGCGNAFPAAAMLQQNLEQQLGKASIAVARVNMGGLSADISCEPAASQMPFPVVIAQQCLSLSQVVSEASAANGLHLATTWRTCESYKCGGLKCAEKALTAQMVLVDRFLPAFAQLRARHETREPAATRPEPPIEASVGIPDLGPAPARTLNPRVVYYGFYILACVAVLVRWEWCR